MSKEFCVSVLYGSDQVRKFYNGEIFNENEINNYIKFYSFKTEKELRAFILGLKEANGWLDLIYLEGVQPKSLLQIDIRHENYI
ncbi:hypothetical protein OF897_13440 [Chryseobacterium formosus]|uniref:Uncharacterized protein n=1 Tax=Chryseobacterium formosus TaxID=1537363 RepID=A0ABT3XS14_9FLAO|nr:hypothetical protein [Chryseobacterium formosus]MCX8524917.1 hypothetical protein [Chryseobacterium formosus]